MQIVETIKAHPVLTGGVVLVGIIAVVMLSSGGSSSVSVTPVPDATASGSDLASQQLQGQIQVAGINAGLQSQMSGQSAAIEVEKIRAQSSFDLANVASGVELANINAAQQVQSQYNVLAATVQGQQIDSANKGIQAQVDMNKNTLDVLQYQIAAGAAVSQASINAQLEATKPHSLFGLLFG